MNGALREGRNPNEIAVDYFTKPGGWPPAIGAALSKNSPDAVPGFHLWKSHARLVSNRERFSER
jgi:hypothetical protein